MKKRNLQPQQTAPVARPQAGGKSATGGVEASIAFPVIIPFAGDDAE